MKPTVTAQRSLANALSPVMTGDFENGYWYLDQLKNFADARYGGSIQSRAVILE